MKDLNNSKGHDGATVTIMGGPARHRVEGPGRGARSRGPVRAGPAGQLVEAGAGVPFADDPEPEDDPVSPVDVVEPDVSLEPEFDDPESDEPESDDTDEESLDGEEDDVVEAAEVLPRLSVL